MTEQTSSSQPTAAVQLAEGMRVRICQQIPQHEEAWSTVVEGEVVSCCQEKTDSSFAHGKDDRFWLDRVEIRKADGELTVCNLDRYSRIEVLGE